MRIKSIKLRGFIGIKKGLGLDEISLDLSNVSGLVALAGPNGHGKTTLLDNMHPFPCLGSRDKALSHHVFLRDSSRELIFDHDGVEYKILIKIDAETDKTEGFMWADGESLVEGKITAYKKKVVEIFGTQTLFFESVFCAQNATKLSEMRTGLLRDLFAEFLKLDELQEKHLTAKQCKNIMEGKVTDKALSINKLNDSLGSLNFLQGELEEKEMLLKQDRYDLEHLTNNYQQCVDFLETVKNLIQDDTVHMVKIEAIETDIRSMTTRHLDDKNRFEQDLNTLRSQAQKLNEDIKEASGILAEKEQILEAIKFIEENTKNIPYMESKIKDNSDTILAAQKALDVMKSELKGLELEKIKADSSPKVTQLESEIKQLEAAALDFDKKDASCTSKTCPFIESAVKAVERLPIIKDELEGLRIIIKAESDHLQIKIDAKEQAIKLMREDIEDLIKETEGLNQELKLISDDIARHQILANKKPALDLAEKTIQEKKDELQGNYQEGIRTKSLLDKLIDDHASIMEAKHIEVGTLKSKLSGSKPEKVPSYEANIKEKQGLMESMKEDIHKKEADLISLKEQIKGLEKVKEQLQDENREKDTLSKEVAEWAWLTTALSKDRLQALEIAGAAPTITGYANQLLSSAFGPQTMVKLQTQDENGKEVLNIQVVDEDGEDVTLSNRSGGQQVWALKALRLAMAMLSKEKSGRNFKTILTDEEDGALDSEKAVMFIHLYRAFMEHGGFDSCFYISHKPECVDMADHVLEFSKGGIEIS